MRVFLLGRDGVGWSIDQDREYTARALRNTGHRLVRTPARADVIYCVWWNLLERKVLRPLRFKRVVAVVTNDMTHQESTFRSIRRAVNVWVVANTAQQRFLLARGIPERAIHLSPFYVDEEAFTPRVDAREELARAAQVEPHDVQGRFLIGSFQRDSLGSDLGSPKWQKNPDLLVAIVEELRATDALLLLAGPRRHYLLEKCRELSIPYLFVGTEPPAGSRTDDIRSNRLPTARIAALWHLLDLYVVTSRSEGGPKAILEGGLTGTPVLSTPVGIAPDLLPSEFIFHDATQGAEAVRRQMAGGDPAALAALVRRVREVNRFEKFSARVNAAVQSAVTASGVS